MGIVTWAQAGKEFPDVRQNAKRIEFVRAGDLLGQRASKGRADVFCRLSGLETEKTPLEEWH